MKKREHWERIDGNTDASEVSWYQPEPNSPIIDVGGGASTLVDGLLDAGYLTLTVLDLSAAALDVARQRLGARAAQVTWIAGTY